MIHNEYPEMMPDDYPETIQIQRISHKPGDAGIFQTVEWMRYFAWEAKAKPIVWAKTWELIYSLGNKGHDNDSDVATKIFEYVQNLKWRPDPLGKELLFAPWLVIANKAGDCEELTCLLAAMLEIAGIKSSFKIISREPNKGFHHVLVLAKVNDEDINLDPSAKKFGMGWCAEGITREAIIPVSGSKMEISINEPKGKTDMVMSSKRSGVVGGLFDIEQPSWSWEGSGRSSAGTAEATSAPAFDWSGLLNIGLKAGLSQYQMKEKIKAEKKLYRQTYGQEPAPPPAQIVTEAKASGIDPTLLALLLDKKETSTPWGLIIGIGSGVMVFGGLILVLAMKK